MVKINFGVSEFTKHFLKMRLWVGRQMDIHESGELPCITEIKYRNPDQANPQKYNFLNYTDVRESRYYTIPAVNFNIISSLSFNGVGVRSEDVVLIWIKERQEWIAVRHYKWPDTSLSMYPHTNESEKGPYSLDDYCKDMICKAYEIDLNKSEDPSKIEPSKLEKIIS